MTGRTDYCILRDEPKSKIIKVVLERDAEIAALNVKVDEQSKDYEKRLNAMDALYNAEKEKLEKEAYCHCGKLFYGKLCPDCRLKEIEYCEQKQLAAIEGEVKKLTVMRFLMMVGNGKVERRKDAIEFKKEVLAIIQRFNEGKT